MLKRLSLSLLECWRWMWRTGRKTPTTGMVCVCVRVRACVRLCLCVRVCAGVCMVLYVVKLVFMYVCMYVYSRYMTLDHKMCVRT